MKSETPAYLASVFKNMLFRNSQIYICLSMKHLLNFSTKQEKIDRYKFFQKNNFIQYHLMAKQILAMQEIDILITKESKLISQVGTSLKNNEKSVLFIIYLSNS